MKAITFFIFTVLFSNNILANCEDINSCLQEVQSVATAGINTDCPKQESPDKNEIKPVADNESGVTFDKNSWKYALAGVVAAPLGFMVGVTIHEGTHCIVANMVEGTDCADIRVIPYYSEEYDYFYFGSTEIDINQDNPPTANGRIMITAAPMMLNAGLITAYSTLAFTDSLPDNKWLKTGMLVLGAAQVVDLFNHSRNEHPYSDSGKIINFLQEEKQLGYDQAYWTVKGPQIGFAVLGTAAIGLEAYRIFTNPSKPKAKKSNFHIVPSVGMNSFNLGINGKF